MLTVLPVVPWPIALIMIRREFDYLGYLYRGKCFGRAAAVRWKPGVVMCSSVVLALQDDSAGAIVEHGRNVKKNKWLSYSELQKNNMKENNTK